MKALKIAVKLDGEIIAKFWLESDAENFAEMLSEMTGKKVIIETKSSVTKVGF